MGANEFNFIADKYDADIKRSHGSIGGTGAPRASAGTRVTASMMHDLNVKLANKAYLLGRVPRVASGERLDGAVADRFLSQFNPGQLIRPYQPCYLDPPNPLPQDSAWVVHKTPWAPTWGGDTYMNSLGICVGPPDLLTSGWTLDGFEYSLTFYATLPVDPAYGPTGSTPYIFQYSYDDFIMLIMEDGILFQEGSDGTMGPAHATRQVAPGVHWINTTPGTKRFVIVGRNKGGSGGWVVNPTGWSFRLYTALNGGLGTLLMNSTDLVGRPTGYCGPGYVQVWVDGIPVCRPYNNR